MKILHSFFSLFAKLKVRFENLLYPTLLKIKWLSMQIFFLLRVVESTHWHFRKAFEEGENGICEQVLIEDAINISNNEEYVDIDSYNEDSVTINSDDSPDSTEEDDASKF